MTRPTAVITGLKRTYIKSEAELLLLAWIDYLESLPEIQRRLEDEAQREFSETVEIPEFTPYE